MIGNLEEAQELLQKVSRKQEEIGDKRGLVWTLCNLGIIARSAHRLDEAEQYLASALVISRELGDPNEIYDGYLNLGDVHMLMDQEEKAANDYTAGANAIESIRANLLVEEEALDFLMIHTLRYMIDWCVFMR